MSIILVVLVGFFGALPILLTKTELIKTRFVIFVLLGVIYIGLGHVLFGVQFSPACPWLGGCISFVAFWWCITAVISGIIEKALSEDQARFWAVWPAMIAILFLAIYRFSNGFI
jgi:hypothetical protein